MQLSRYVLFSLFELQGKFHDWIWQARFFLSTTEVWGSEDGDFDLEDFHSAIMQLFESDAADPGDDEWARTTLMWWDKYKQCFLVQLQAC